MEGEIEQPQPVEQMQAVEQQNHVDNSNSSEQRAQPAEPARKSRSRSPKKAEDVKQGEANSASGAKQSEERKKSPERRRSQERKRSMSAERKPEAESCVIVIHHVEPSQQTEAEIRAALSSFGEIQSVEHYQEFELNRSYGFVKFSTPEAARKAAAERTVKIAGKSFDLHSTDRQIRVFIGNLPRDATQSSTEKFVMKLTNNEKKYKFLDWRNGFAFLVFRDQYDAYRVIKALQGKSSRNNILLASLCLLLMRRCCREQAPKWKTVC